MPSDRHRPPYEPSRPNEPGDPHERSASEPTPRPHGGPAAPEEPPVLRHTPPGPREDPAAGHPVTPTSPWAMPPFAAPSPQEPSSDRPEPEKPAPASPGRRARRPVPPDKLVATGPPRKPSRARKPYSSSDPQEPPSGERVGDAPDTASRADGEGAPTGTSGAPTAPLGGGRYPAEPPSALRRSMPTRGRRRRRGVLSAAVALAVAVGLGVVVWQWVLTPATGGLRLAAGESGTGDDVFAVPAGATGSTQVLNAVAAAGDTIVAVGSDTTSPVPRPLFLVSVDGGESWRLGDVAGQGGPDAGPSTVGRVTGGGGRWLAVENGAMSGPTRGMWVSTDGSRWTLVPADRLAEFRPQDRVTDLARTESGFVAVGSTVVVGGLSGPLAWISPDGVSWTRLESRDLGPVDRVRGIASVAARGDTVVALADHPSGDSAVVLRSTDGGRTWTGAGTVVPDVRPRTGSLAATSDGFVLVPLWQRADAGDVPVHCSKDGARWSRCGSIGGLPRDSTGVSEIASSSAGLTAIVETGFARYRVHTSEDGRSWRARAELSVPGAMRAVAVSDAGTLVVGGDRSSSDVDNRLMLMAGPRDGKLEAVDLNGIDGLVRPARETARIAAGEGRYVAVGTAAGDAGIWTSTDGRRWEAAGSASVLGGPRRQELRDVARGGRGWIAVGNTMRDSVTVVPLIVISADGLDWDRAEGGEGLVPADGHHFLAPHAVAAGETGYVLAGEDRDVGTVVPALWFTSDLKRYTRVKKLPAGGTGVRIHDVAAVSGGYVAVGGAGTPQHEEGVVWTSDDGLNWTAHARVSPPQARSAGLRHVVAFGERVIAAGTARTDSGRRAFAAVSDDGGASWEYAWLPTDDAAAVHDLAATADGLVAVGWHGRSADSDSAAWTSEDGFEWRRQELPQDTMGGPGAQWLGAVAIFGGDVVAVGRSTTYRTDHLTLWRTALDR